MISYKQLYRVPSRKRERNQRLEFLPLKCNLEYYSDIFCKDQPRIHCLLRMVYTFELWVRFETDLRLGENGGIWGRF